MKYLNYKKIMAIMMSGFVLSSSACSKTDAKEIYEVNYNSENVVSNYEKIVKNKDQDIIKYFEEQKNIIVNSRTTKEAKRKVIKAFITMTDFIFYNKEIHGITYNELKEETKENIKDTYFEVDSIIENKFPNYKNNISKKYKKAKSWLKKKYTLIINKAKENLNDDSKNNIENTKEELQNLKDSLKDTSDSLCEDGKEKVKSWYEEIRNSYK